MGRRFSDIKRGAQLKDALDKYITYLSTPRVRNVNSRGPRGATTGGSILAYGLTNTHILVRFPVTENRVPAAFFSASTSSAVADTPNQAAIRKAGFTAARMVTQSGARSVQTETSEITGNRYLKYNGLTRRSSPFGATAAGDKMLTAFDQLRAYALENLTGEIRRSAFTEENISA